MTKQFCLALVIAVALISPAAEKRKKPSPAELAEITARGRMLAEYDNAAWHASDAMMALKPEKGSIERYVGRKTDEGWVVVWGRFNEAKDKFLVVYEALRQSPSSKFTVKKPDPIREDTDFFLRAARAIAAVLQDFRGEQRPYNVSILPAGEQWHVYVLPAQTKPDVYLLGGDTRYLISGDGTSIIEKRQLHKSILEYDGDSGTGQKTVAGVHNHILSEVPEDTDVFYVLTRKPSLPEFVGTPKQVFVVEPDGTIRLAK